VILFAFNYLRNSADSDIQVRISKALSRYQKITFRMETRYSRTLVLLPRLSPIGKIVHLIGDILSHFFGQIGKQPNFGGN
jgi:hypothetical protein